MELPERKSIRLKNYDYSSPGTYFVTICVKDRKTILSNIIVGASIARPYEENQGNNVKQASSKTDDAC